MCVYASASRVETTWRFVSAPRLKKKRGKKRGIERPTPPPPTAVRSHAAACLHEANRWGRRGNPISRMRRAGLTRLSPVRLGDLSIPGRITWLPFNRPFDCFPAYSTCLVFPVYSLPYFPSFSFVFPARSVFSFSQSRRDPSRRVTLVE